MIRYGACEDWRERTGLDSQLAKQFGIYHIELGVVQLCIEIGVVRTCLTCRLTLPYLLGRMIVELDLQSAPCTIRESQMRPWRRRISPVGQRTLQDANGRLARPVPDPCICLLYTSPSPRDRG